MPISTRAQRFSSVEDVMLLAPLALGVARPERVAASREAVGMIAADAVTWPMFASTAAEAALAADLPAKAADLAWTVCERTYRFWDARVADPQRTLPGIACEYWPLDGRCGGEGYGWGAFTTHLVLRGLVGLTPTREHLSVRPNLPAAWRVPGRRYCVRLRWRERPLLIALEPLGAERVAVVLNDRRTEIAWGEAVVYSWLD